MELNITFKRQKELQLLLDSRGNGKIKVIEGLRQVGKSFLLKQIFFNALLNSGVNEDEIAVLDFLRTDNEIRTESELKEKVREIISGKKIKYLFMDEIQLVTGYGNALKTLHIQNPGIDIYVTGSNSKTLSKDIKREIGGEDSFEIIIRPLTFEEAKIDYPDITFTDYFNYGGLPKIIRAKNREDKISAFKTLYDDTYEKDIIDRTKDLTYIGEKEKKRILQRIFDTITTGVSLKSISRQINADNKSPNKNSAAVHADVDSFFKRLNDSFLFEEMNEDSSTKDAPKKPIEDRGKCYCEDSGLLRYVSKSNDMDSAVFENLIFNDLFNKGYGVSSLKFDYFDTLTGTECKNRGIDFCFETDGITYLVQAALVLLDGDNYQREVHNLIFSKKPGKKIVVYLSDRTTSHPNNEGIEFVQIEEFLRKF